MSFSRQCRPLGQNNFSNYCLNDFRSSSSDVHNNGDDSNGSVTFDIGNHDSAREFPGKQRQRLFSNTTFANTSAGDATIGHPSKRRKSSSTNFFWERGGNHCPHPYPVNSGSNVPSISSSLFLGPVVAAATVPHCSDSHAFSSNMCSGQTKPLKLEEDPVIMSRDEIEKSSPSRKDGIDLIHETHLRYSYCAFLQNLGMQLELPQTTIGTAMVLCHRFFVRRSHACHDRFLIGTAALFLAAKSEETPRPLNTVLRASCEICHKQDLAFFSYLLPVDWFEQYREHIIETEQMLLTTLNFELNVRHPYIPLTSVLNKLGLSQTVLVNLALNLVNEGLRSSLWLQFKPHHIAAGAAFLAAKFLNFNLASYHSIWHEFQTTPSILQDVVQQLMELF